MIKVKTKIINGCLTPVDTKGNPTMFPDSPFGRIFNGNEWLIFESQQEADENTPVTPLEPNQGAAVQALLNATPEEIEIIKQILKS